MARIVEANEEAIATAAKTLRDGGIVAFPTETVYGLGADTFQPDALKRIYTMKGRPADNPLIAHILDASQVKRVVQAWDHRCEVLADRFWPGPLTLVLPKADDVPDEATAELATIAIRCPAHSIARQLLHEFQSPVSAPSANRSGKVSPTRPQHVLDDFADSEELMILDGGPCSVGIESTVLDLTGSNPRILRPGTVTAEMLQSVVGEIETAVVDVQSASPGTSPIHYAPVTPVKLVTSKNLESHLQKVKSSSAVLCFDSHRVAEPHRAFPMPHDPQGYAMMLYETLRKVDNGRFERIVIETPPNESVWAAILNRLQRAAGIVRSG